ncbi:gasdermin-D [Acomys russatus]|uniref:gasdermin-D n=1 Tax=Acomys russatus TaxID=60746 RepID=UPI0021E224BA|nr:gasdermin-D [Acomys russatus]
MSSAFQGVVKSVIKEVDPRGELIPVDSLRNSSSIRPYCLLSKKLSSSLFWRPRYTCVNLSIKDILEPNAPEPEPACHGCYHFSDAVDGNVQGSVALSGTGQGEISGGAAVSNSSSASVNVCIQRVTQNTWDIMQLERHLRQPENKTLQQLRSCGVNLFVVTEVLQTLEEVQLTRTHSKEGSGQFAVPGVICFQGEGKGQRSWKRTVTIPAGSVLAFKVAQLLIDPKWGECRGAVSRAQAVWHRKQGNLSGLNILLFPNEKQRTFELSPSGNRREDSQGRHAFGLRGILGAICEAPMVLPSATIDGSYEEEEISEDFQGLCAEVKASSTVLGCLDMELRQQLLVAIGKILQDQPSMEALETSLEQGLCSGGKVEPLEGPAGSILECLVFETGELEMKLAAPVFYLLEALSTLSETQQQLLAKALETTMMTTVLSKQLELVKHILEQTTPWQNQSSVPLPARLLGDSWDEEDPTWVLLEECGLRLQANPPQVHWEPESQGPTCALCASLDLLAGLSQKPC